jgi:hypothetical protein
LVVDDVFAMLSLKVAMNEAWRDITCLQKSHDMAAKLLVVLGTSWVQIYLKSSLFDSRKQALFP